MEPGASVNQTWNTKRIRVGQANSDMEEVKENDISEEKNEKPH